MVKLKVFRISHSYETTDEEVEIKDENIVNDWLQQTNLPHNNILFTNIIINKSFELKRVSEKWGKFVHVIFIWYKI